MEAILELTSEAFDSDVKTSYFSTSKIVIQKGVELFFIIFAF